MAATGSQNGANLAPTWSKMEPKWVKISKKIGSKKQRNKKEGGTPQGRSIFAEKVANMAPSWLPKSIKNQLKIDAKIDQKFDASWDRFLVGFWRILEGKMEPSWHQNRSKINANCEV